MSIKVLLTNRVDDFIKEYPEFKGEGVNKKFLFFTIFHLFKDLKIEYEDILNGIVDNSNDYGIDAIFLFSAGEIISEEEDITSQIGKESKIKIQLIQVTRDSGFSENVLLKLKNGIEEIFDIGSKINGNEAFKNKVKLIRGIWEYCFKLGIVNLIEVEILYACLNEDEKINNKIEKLENKIYDFLKSQQLNYGRIKYIGIPSLYKIISEENYEKELLFKDVIPYAEPYNTKVLGYYGLVKLGDLLRFITDDTGEIIERYFEGNVRDYYGITKRVNQKIKNTLESQDRVNFWCLNNGLTVICDKFSPLGKKIKLFNFHIVNGCQTAHVIYSCKEILKDEEQSEIFVKVIQTGEEGVLNDIIEATNSQTSVSSIALHSNELIQKNIEEHFLKNSGCQLFYERRLNFYKRRHKPRNRIVTIIKLFQVFYSIFEKKPSTARGRPAETFDKHYDLVFNTVFDYDSYLLCILFYTALCNINRVESKKPNKDKFLDLVQKYGQFHIARVAFVFAIGKDEKVNLLDKKNIFIKNKDKLFSLIKNEKNNKRLYVESVNVVKKCVKESHKKHGDLILSYNLFKSDELDKLINLSLNK